MGCAANGKALESKALLAETERTVADLRGAVDQSRHETRRFQDEHDAVLRERDQALSELQEFHSQLKASSKFTDFSELHELRGQLRDAEANLGQECSRRCRFENRVTALEGESRALRDELLAASASKAAERKASEKFRQDVGARDAVLTELRARASQLASEHEHMSAERDSLAAEREHLSRERDQARQELHEALRKAEASSATAAAAEAAAAEASATSEAAAAAAASVRSCSPAPHDSSKLAPPASSSGRRTPVRSPRGDAGVHQQLDGRPPRAPGSTGKRSNAPSPSPEPYAAPAGAPPVAERKRHSRKPVSRASSGGGVNVPRNSSDFIELDGTASVQSDAANTVVKAKRRSKGKGKGEIKAELKTAAAGDELTIETEARSLQQTSTAPSGRRSRSGSAQQTRTAGSISTVESAAGTSTTAGTSRSSGRTSAGRRTDKADRPSAPWDDDSSSEEEHVGSTDNSTGNAAAPAAASAQGGAQRRPSLPAVPGSSRPSLSAPWDEPSSHPNSQASSRPGSRTSSRRPSLSAPWDENDEGRQRLSQTLSSGSRAGSRRPSVTAPLDQPDEGQQSSNLGRPRPAIATTAPWDEPDDSDSASGSLQPAARPRPKAAAPAEAKSKAAPPSRPSVGSEALSSRQLGTVQASQQGGKAARPASAGKTAAPAPLPAGVQLNGKAAPKAKAPAAAKSSPAISSQAKPEPREDPSVQVFRFDFSVFDFLKHEALQTPSPLDKREHMAPERGSSGSTVGSPPVMLGAVAAAPLFAAGRGATANGAGSPGSIAGKSAGGNKADPANKPVPKLKLNADETSSLKVPARRAADVGNDSSGSETLDPTLSASMPEAWTAARKKSTPPEIAGTPALDDEQESLGDDDWPPQARRSSAARRV